MSVTVTEPRFTPDEVDLLLASRRKDDEPRGAHGFTIAEASDPENQFAFEVEDPLEDHAQFELDRAKERYQRLYPDADMGSKLWRVKKRD